MSASWLRIGAQKGEKLRKSGSSVRSGHLQSANMLSEIPKSVNQIVNHPSVFVLNGCRTRERHTVDLAIDVNNEYKCATVRVFYWGSRKSQVGMGSISSDEWIRLELAFGVQNPGLHR